VLIWLRTKSRKMNGHSYQDFPKFIRHEPNYLICHWLSLILEMSQERIYPHSGSKGMACHRFFTQKCNQSHHQKIQDNTQILDEVTRSQSADSSNRSEVNRPSAIAITAIKSIREVDVPIMSIHCAAWLVASTSSDRFDAT